MSDNEEVPMGYYVVHVEMGCRNVAVRAKDRIDLTDEQVVMRTLNHMRRNGDLEPGDKGPLGGEITILRFATEAEAKQAFDNLGPADAVVVPATGSPAATIH